MAGTRLDPEIFGDVAREDPEVWERLAGSAAQQSDFAGALASARA